MPYSSAMDFSAYDQRPDFTPIITTTRGMSVGSSSSLTHSWLVPTKDLSNDNYNQQNAVMQSLNTGHVFILFYLISFSIVILSIHVGVIF